MSCIPVKKSWWWRHLMPLNDPICHKYPTDPKWSDIGPMSRFCTRPNDQPMTNIKIVGYLKFWLYNDHLMNDTAKRKTWHGQKKKCPRRQKKHRKISCLNAVHQKNQIERLSNEWYIWGSCLFFKVFKMSLVIPCNDLKKKTVKNRSRLKNV